TFGTPNHHPRSQPFFDHVFSFSALRFVFETQIRYLPDRLKGGGMYDNPDYESPNAKRRALKLLGKGKYIEKQLSKKAALSKAQQIKEVIAEKVEDPVGEVFEIKDEPLDEEAQKIVYR
ncbi:hypothetical protein COOONC_15018, partial [Cooperia oncophora]